MDFAATQNFCEGATQNFCDGDESDEEDKPQLIRLLDGGNAGVTMLPSVDGGVLFIGRAASDDGASALLLTDESQPQPPKVSARQAEVRLVNGAFTLHVLSSATFTFVNEQHYIKPGGGSPPAVSLFHEDTLRFGGGIKASQRYDKFVFRVHAPEHPRPGNNGVAAAAQGGVTGEMPIVAEQIGSGEGEWAKASLLPAVATEAAIAAPSAATSSEAPSAPAASLLGKRAAPASDVMLGAAAGGAVAGGAVAGGAVAGGEPASTESASAGQASVAGSAGREFQVATLSSSARGVERGFKVRFSARGPEQAGWSSVLPPVLQFAVVKRESIAPSLQRVAFRLTDLAGEFEPWLKFVRSSSSRCGCMQLPGGASVITTAVVGSELACELVGGGGALAEMERQLAAKSRAMSELAAERDAEAAARKEAEERAVELQQEVEEWENLSRDAATMREGVGQQADCGPGELTQQVDDLWSVVEEPGDELRQRDQVTPAPSSNPLSAPRARAHMNALPARSGPRVPHTPTRILPPGHTHPPTLPPRTGLALPTAAGAHAKSATAAGASTKQDLRRRARRPHWLSQDGAARQARLAPRKSQHPRFSVQRCAPAPPRGECRFP